MLLTKAKENKIDAINRSRIKKKAILTVHKRSKKDFDMYPLKASRSF